MVGLAPRTSAFQRSLAPVAAVVLGAVAVGCAPKPAPEMAAVDGRQCFYADRISGFTAVSDRTVNVGVGVSEVYRFELFAPCPDVDWASRIAVVSHASSWICSGLDATLIAPSSIGPQRCPVRRITRLSPPQVAALPPGQRP